MKINEIIIPTSLWQHHEDCIPQELTTWQDPHSRGFLLNVLFWQQEGVCVTSSHISMHQRGLGSSHRVSLWKQSSSALPCSAKCCRVYLYHSSHNLALEQPPKPQGSHTHTPLPLWVRRCSRVHCLRKQFCRRCATRQFSHS